MNTVPEIIKAIQNGEMVIVVDSEDRENEGDVVMAAEMVTPQAINFMITHCRGLICVPLAEERIADYRRWYCMGNCVGE
jgi:3,4-dihydroxy 2-butanone 4-phosphate synthase/GTP cyclohydrolase II